MKLESLDKDYTYHIYNKGINGENIFINDENKTYFLKLMAKYLNDKSSIYAYCLMNNHFHILMKVNTSEGIVTQALSNFFNAYAKAFNKATERTESLFEKHFKRIRVENENYIRRLVAYIHLNPKHHFDEDFETFKYSSYPAFLSDRETKLEREEILELFGGRDNFIFVHKQQKDLLNEKYTLE